MMIGDIYLFYPEKESFLSSFVGGYLGGVIHSAIEISNVYTDVILIEASAMWNRVILSPLSSKKGRIYEIYRLKEGILSSFNMEKAVKWALNQVGKKYDFLQILGILLKRSIGRTSKYICSEFVVKFYEVGGVRLCKDKKLNLIVPTDFQKDNNLMKIKDGIV